VQAWRRATHREDPDDDSRTRLFCCGVLTVRPKELRKEQVMFLITAMRMNGYCMAKIQTEFLSSQRERK
jgi:hypothetical protein